MRITVTLPEALIEALDQLAGQQGVSRSAVIERALAGHVAAEDRQMTETINRVLAECEQEEGTGW
jgi:metal-responsive CopG/Arc/MetJ family transcriptional regulator